LSKQQVSKVKQQNPRYRRGPNHVMETLTTAITLTYFTDTIDEPLINTIAILEQNNYKITHLSVGKHTDASRPHYHIGLIVSYTAKKYLKNFNRSLTPKLKSIECDKKISYYHSNEPVYNPDKGLMYPLKEVEHETENIRLYHQYSRGIPEPQFRELMDKAQNEYLIIQNKKKAKEAEDNDKRNTSKEKYQMLDEHIGTDIVRFRDKSIQTKIRECMHVLLKHARNEYHRNEKYVFRINSMMELVISYLYNKQHIDEDELIDYKFQGLKFFD